MKSLLTRRDLMTQGTRVVTGGSLAALLAGARPTMISGSGHEITVVSWHSHHGWHSRGVKRFNAIQSQVLPWQDPLVGGATLSSG